MAQDEAKPDHAPNKDQVAANEHEGREVLTASNFIVVAATVVAAVSALLAARFTTLSTWTIVLVPLGLALALAVMFTRLAKTKWFYPAASWTVIIALVVSGLYMTAKGKQAQASPRTQNLTSSLPSLRFVEADAQDVCQVYFGTGTIPKGYDLLVFDSYPGGTYYMDGLAANQSSGGWSSPLVMAGNNPTVISAVLVPAATGNFLSLIFVYSDEATVEAKIRSGQLGLTWLSPVLPYSEENIPSLTVHPPKGLSGCPPG